MRAILDLNVVLDVVQRREPHYAASAAVVSRAVEQGFEGVLPSHALPTLYYIVGRFAGRDTAGELVDWLLRHFEVAEAGKTELVRLLPGYEPAELPVHVVFPEARLATAKARTFIDFVVPALRRGLIEHAGDKLA